MSALLEVRRLTKRFGGVVATDQVSLDVRPGTIHALIGPNGAGKTSLVAQLAGQLHSDSGSVHFDGHNVTRWPAHRLARHGLVRSFQITRLFRSFSVREQLALAVQASRGSSLNPWRSACDDPSLWARADALLDELDLAAQANAAVDALAHDQRRMLEIGLALASKPKMVLLDEPMAGLGPDESARMEAWIGRLRGNTTVLLIEHDVEAVFRLADEVSVLLRGSVIANGSPQAVRADRLVTDAYLGHTP